jgi:hypothetical protein
MAPKHDRNEIILGPARLKVEDEIYQAADQGIVSPPTPSTPDTGGYDPLGPGGPLITPPVINGPDGYPIPRSVRTPAAEGSIWSLINGTAYGWFPRTFVTGATVINLDNITQSILYPPSAGFPGTSIFLRPDGLWDRDKRWNGTAWLSQPTSVLNRRTGTTITNTRIGTTQLWFGSTTLKSDFVNRRYSVLAGTGFDLEIVYFSETGAFSFAHTGAAGTPVAALGDVMWYYYGATSVNTSQPFMRAINTTSLALGPQYGSGLGGAAGFGNAPVTFPFMLNDGSLCRVEQPLVVSYPLTYSLVCYSPTGVISTQTNFYTAATSAERLTSSVELPTQSLLATTSGGALLQMNSAGYSVIQTTPLASNLYWPQDGPGSVLRFSNSTDFYEVSL